MKSFTTTALSTVIISLLTLAGVVLHDTKLDKLARTFMGVPSVMALTEGVGHSMKADDHTHVERISLSQMKSSDQPRLAPRYLEQKKHMMQKSVPRGTHNFDFYNMPI